jgi:hypothetical protein
MYDSYLCVEDDEVDRVCSWLLDFIDADDLAVFVHVDQFIVGRSKVEHRS